MFQDSNINHPPVNAALKPPTMNAPPNAQPLSMAFPTNPSMTPPVGQPLTNSFAAPDQNQLSHGSPALRSTYQNHSSLNSSRNSSPAFTRPNLTNNPPFPNNPYNQMNQNFPRAPLDNMAPGMTPLNQPPAPRIPQNQTGPPPIGNWSINNMSQSPYMTVRPPSSAPPPTSQPYPVASFPRPPPTSIPYSQTQSQFPPMSQNSTPLVNTSQSFPQSLSDQNSLKNAHNMPPNTQVSRPPPMLPQSTGPSSMPFPNRQINQTLPPLVPQQGPSAFQSFAPPVNVPPPSDNPLPPPPMKRSEPPQMMNPNDKIQPPPQNMFGSNVMHGPSYNAAPPMPPQMSQPTLLQPNQHHPNANQYQTPGGPVAPQHYNGQQDLSHQMGRLNVAQGSINKIWGNESVDLLQCRSILPETKLEPPPIKLNQHFTHSVNCSPDIFRCTLTKIPETNALLQKSRLPLGILIHPFKDLTHLPVIQCSSIVRCRSCRTYINPFVYIIDTKRWKCNLCYRINDLPEEFQFDPVTKSYGDPMRRPEIQSATIEYIAPSEYMLRPPQPAVYLFLLDVSASAIESGYLKIFCDTLTEQIDNLPGDSRTQLAFICYDSAVHYYFLGEGASRPKEMTVIDIDDIFLPSPEDLLVNLVERRTAILELLAAIPGRYASNSNSNNQSALGAALIAAQKLITPTGGRITIFQASLPNVGPGALQPREDPNNRSSKEVAHLNPATDFYKRQALNCSGVHIAVDLFLLNCQFADLSTISGVSRFSGGSIHHIPLFKANREWQAQELKRCLTRYLTRKIGFEAVMRVRCTRGLAIHAFHGSFFVRSTDLLSLPNVNPDAGFGMQLAIEENLSDAQHVCFQAAVLYTSSKGERRIRVHTLCLPVATILSDIIHSADQQCIVGLLAKMAVDRSQTSSLSDAREALINAAVDALGTFKQISGPAHGLICSMQLRLLPLYLLALLKCRAFRTGTSTRLDDRIASMCDMKSLPLANLMRNIYPDLYPVHRLADFVNRTNDDNENDENCIPTPPRLRLSAEKVSATGAYLLDQENVMVLYVGHTVHTSWLQNTLGVNQHSQIPDELHTIPTLETEENVLLHSFIDHLNEEKPYAATLHILRDNSPNRSMFTDKLVDDRVESALSYYEFLQHIKSLIK